MQGLISFDCIEQELRDKFVAHFGGKSLLTVLEDSSPTFSGTDAELLMCCVNCYYVLSFQR